MFRSEKRRRSVLVDLAANRKIARKAEKNVILRRIGA